MSDTSVISVKKYFFHVYIFFPQFLLGMGCGGNITGINGSFTSPSYPGNYTERHSCRWLISVPARRVIIMTFTDLNLIGSPDCNRDYVEAYNGDSDRAPVLGRFCGNVNIMIVEIILLNKYYII